MGITVTRVFNRTSEKGKRRGLRKRMPRAEVLLWSKLRGQQVTCLRFRRQYSVGPYALDFYCPEAKLAVEVDGNIHFGDGAEERDAERQLYVESFGIRFMRCTNEDVYENMEGVLEEIERVAFEGGAWDNPPQSPLGKGGS